MTIDDLWQLHEQVAAKLTRELAIKKARLEERLRKLRSAVIISDRQTPSVPEGPSQIPESEKSCRDLVWPRETTPGSQHNFDLVI
jgi:hypothetical protein